METIEIMEANFEFLKVIYPFIFEEVFAKIKLNIVFVKEDGEQAETKNPKARIEYVRYIVQHEIRKSIIEKFSDSIVFDSSDSEIECLVRYENFVDYLEFIQGKYYFNVEIL